MWQQPNHFILHSYAILDKSAIETQLTIQLIAELQAFLTQLISARKKILIQPIRQYQGLKNRITKAFMDLIYSIQLELNKEKLNQQRPILISAKNEIPMSLLKGLCLMSQHGLFQTECKYHCQLALSMLFEKSLAETFRLCLLSQEGVMPKDTKMTFEQLDDIFESLLAPDYRWKFMTNIYTLHSGTTLSIERSGFEQNLKYIITNIGRSFTQKNNLMTRNLRNVKKSQFITDIVSHSMKTICNYKNGEFIQNEISEIAQIIFKNNLKITKDQFLCIMKEFLNNFGSSAIGFKSKPLNKTSSKVVHILWLYLDLLRVEALMLQDPQLMETIKKQQQVDSSNFYSQEMQKLLQKCPFNGDESCDCKKCNCIRRNRESAKISQQKKRNAVEQIYPLKKKIQELEKRNKQINEENKILRGIVSELNKFSTHEIFNFQSTMQSVTKVLDN